MPFVTPPIPCLFPAHAITAQAPPNAPSPSITAALPQRPATPFWRSVAASRTIVTGTITKVEYEEGRPRQIQLQITGVLKGQKYLLLNDRERAASPSSMMVFGDFSPASKENDARLTVGASAVAFLAARFPDEDKVAQFAGISTPPASVIPVTPDLTDAIITEVKNQESIAADYKKLAIFQPVAADAKVKKLIDGLLDETKAQASVNALLKMKWSAAPALVRLIDDKRLPTYILLAFPLPPNSRRIFESEYYFRTSTITCTITAILMELPGSLENGFSDIKDESERRETMNAWRVFLYYRSLGFVPDK